MTVSQKMGTILDLNLDIPLASAEYSCKKQTTILKEIQDS